MAALVGLAGPLAAVREALTAAVSVGGGAEAAMVVTPVVTVAAREAEVMAARGAVGWVAAVRLVAMAEVREVAA